MVTAPQMPPNVADAYAQFTPQGQKRLHELRVIVFDAAAATGVDPLEETLKWGQPSLVPPKKFGTTMRFGESQGNTPYCALYVHCQTTLVGDWRQAFPDEFEYQDKPSRSDSHNGTL